MISQLSNKEFVNELRCLRMHLSPLLTPKYAEMLQEAERRINPGAVSTGPANLQSKKRKTQKTEHQELVAKFYFKT